MSVHAYICLIVSFRSVVSEKMFKVSYIVYIVSMYILYILGNLGSLCVMFSCVIRCPGSSVMLDCINFGYLPSSLVRLKGTYNK